MVFRTLKNFTAAKRIPLIKFRKGGNQAAAAPSTAPNQGAQSTAIEEFELPSRYWRKPIDPAEMDYINNGGPP